MSNFAEDIEEAAEGEPIEALIIHDFGWGHYGADRDELGYKETDAMHRACAYTGQLVDWATIRPLLDYEYDAGFGSAECHMLTAWTSSRVLWVDEYDGSTRVLWLPRNPTVVVPSM